MRSFTVTEAKNRLEDLLDDAQRQPIAIREDDRDGVVVLSIAQYERLRSGLVRAFLDVRNEVARDAAAAGLKEDQLTALLKGN